MTKEMTTSNIAQYIISAQPKLFPILIRDCVQSQVTESPVKGALKYRPIFSSRLLPGYKMVATAPAITTTLQEFYALFYTTLRYHSIVFWPLLSVMRSQPLFVLFFAIFKQMFKNMTALKIFFSFLVFSGLITFYLDALFLYLNYC